MKTWKYGAMIAALTCIGCFCGYMYCKEVLVPAQQLDEAAKSQAELFEEIRQSFSEESEAVQSATAIPAVTEETAAETAATEPKSAAVAWLTIPGTHIDYPVAQAEDNEFYLYRGIDGKLNQRLGCPFLDYRCNPDFMGFNSIVYAHHMTKQRMFADIALYQDSTFMERCPEGILTTSGGQKAVRFFAYLSVPSDDPLYTAEFNSTEEQERYLDYLTDSAVYVYQMTAEDLKNTEDLHLLLLSTCTFEYEASRGVLVGVIGN